MGTFSARFFDSGFAIDTASNCVYFNGEICYELIGFMNSKVAADILSILNPTINFSCGVIALLPFGEIKSPIIADIVRKCIHKSKQDWDSFETSWNFQHHPLLRKVSTIAEAFNQWQTECDNRFNQLKANEEELNRIFIDIYGLQDELTPDVADRDVTVHRVYDTRDDVPEFMKGSSYVRTKRDEIVSLISYAVGCMLGRYSLDVEGLAYAGGDWDDSRYTTFIPVRDNIIPICDDEYFENDMTALFVKWVETVYGAESLEANLNFVADALGSKGTSRETIRNYFLSEFYADHCKTYQKRPIYWLFDSGKKNGFKALTYMHRYQSDLLARMRTDYVHEMQERYRSQLAALSQAIEHAQTAERVKLTKRQKKLQEQALEIQKYEEKIHHLADMNIEIDLDDGVKHNYALFADVLAKIK